MNHIFHRARFAFCIPVATMILTSCGGEATPTATPIVNAPVDQNAFLLDPLTANTESERYLAWQVYDQVSEVIEVSTPTPCKDSFGTAQEWCLEIKPIEGLTWHDGTPVVPEDLVGSFEVYSETLGHVLRTCPNVTPTIWPRFETQDGKAIMRYAVNNSCRDEISCAAVNLREISVSPLKRPDMDNVGTGSLGFVQTTNDGRLLFETDHDHALLFDPAQPIATIEEICGNNCGKIPQPTPVPICPDPTEVN